MEEDTLRLIERGLRESDVVEVKRMANVGPVEALTLAYREGRPHVFTIVAGSTPCAMFGVVEGTAPSIGSVWLLGTDDILTIRRQFTRRCREWVEWMNTLYAFLTNYVDAENEVSIEWLRACGFTIDEQTTDINGFPFYLFWRNSS